MIGLIWVTVAAYSIQILVHGARNPYKEALLARPWESVQKYVIVRPGAHMFYWFYYADGTKVCAESKPLIIWIQGGPGFAASGLANFAEIGPLTMNMEPRNHTWVKGRNVLLIDHPVGTGFSYVTNESLLVRTDREIVADLYKTIEAFFGTHERFRKTPTYIFGQSYGGKICPKLAYYLHKKILNKSLIMNLKGIGISGGVVNPLEDTLTISETLYNQGLIDQNKYLIGMALGQEIRNYFSKKHYVKAEILLCLLFIYLGEEAGVEINFNNMIQPSPYSALMALQEKVNAYVKPMISDVVDQKFEWKFASLAVYNTLNEALMVPSTKFLEWLLNKTEIKVAVYAGNLDISMTVAGTSNWVHKLKWNGSEDFKYAARIPIRGTNNGFYKETKQLSLWWIYGSGQWVPEDNPEAMEQILEHIISDK